MDVVILVFLFRCCLCSEVFNKKDEYNEHVNEHYFHMYQATSSTDDCLTSRSDESLVAGRDMTREKKFCFILPFFGEIISFVSTILQCVFYDI